MTSWQGLEGSLEVKIKVGGEKGHILDLELTFKSRRLDVDLGNGIQ